jgi:hypothetical protein
MEAHPVEDLGVGLLAAPQLELQWPLPPTPLAWAHLRHSMVLTGERLRARDCAPQLFS